MANVDSYTKALLDSEITTTLTDIINNMINRLGSPQEPDYIAALVCDFPKKLREILVRNIPNLEFRTCGCFIHQKPLVQFVDSKKYGKTSPEIGDLLIIYKEIDGDHALYNALLLQAKVIKSNSAKRVNEPHQLILYTQWPHFMYKKAGYLNGEERDVYPKTVHSGAQYLLINNVTGNPLFGCATANELLNVSISFAGQLIRLIEFQVGGTFVSKAQPIIDDWSWMIWDLLEITQKTSFKRKNFSSKREKRHCGDTIDMLSTNDIKDTIEVLLDKLENESDNIGEGYIDDGNPGISLICIEGKRVAKDNPR